MEISGNPIFKKVTLFWQGTDSRAFVLHVESIIEIMRNPIFLKNIPARGRLFVQADNWFFGWWKPFFLHFLEILTNNFA